MKKICFIFLICTVSLTAEADHITGGEMFYSYSGFNNGLHQYNVTLKLYMRCNSGRNFNNPTIVSIFDRVTGQRVKDIYVDLSKQENIKLPSNSDPCVTNPPFVCYDVAYYFFDVFLAASANGYVLASQVNYRIAGINNLAPGYGLIGATYITEIPGTNQGSHGPQNNSAKFIGSDLVMVCAENPFSYSFAATDADNDDLQYSFCGAYVSGTSSTVSIATPPPYQMVPYGSGFAESFPLGSKVKIDANTGKITGIAPKAGVYVVTVCVQEMRNGMTISTQRKDLQIFIAPCSIAAAALPTDYMLCRDSMTIQLSNGSTSPLINTYHWQIINSAGNSIYNSSAAKLDYRFTDTGSYNVNLYINRGQQCSDSASTIVRVYPGLIPTFDFNGVCFTKPTNFADKTSNIFGKIDSWKWDFGETNRTNDISSLQNPVYTYPSQGDKIVQLIVTNTMGCRDTFARTVPVSDRPPIQLLFRDTLICVNDNLMLKAIGGGLFSWTPLIDITNSNSSTPVVSPKITTSYKVHLNDNGCLNSDSVLVRVVDHVTLQAMKDTVICSGDKAMLTVNSDALRYSWSPAASFIDPLIANAICTTNSTSTYQVTASIGGCVATEDIVVSTVPYPLADAGKDTVICYGTPGQLKGSTNASSYNWSPSATISSFTALNPFVAPKNTTAYVLSAYEDNGCPKPGRDTMIMTVRDKIKAFAGRDTAIIVGQPLHFKATGGIVYQWQPRLHLSSPDISNPVGVFTDESDRIRYTVFVFDEKGCFDTASVLISVYKTMPSVFVPNAFTPNNDKLNDLLRPIAAGIEKIEFFKIYNRWGQLVFSTTVNGYGWDGKINGQEQGAQTYIWVVKAVDFKGQPYFQKGMVNLIR